ncbi:MAG: glycerate kinase [Actinomycetota bacterium]|nr:glycerate kinase [Actinomycetota bacterium]
MSHVLIAPDKFKGSVTATEAADSLAKGVASRIGRGAIRCVPVADGGEGTLDVALASGYRRVPVTVCGPTGNDVRSAIAVRGDTAVVEMAAASGLSLLPDQLADPMRATSTGTGQLVLAALDNGCSNVVLGVGGSASTDGGSGMLAALGARLLDVRGERIGPGGQGLRLLATVDMSDLDPRLHRTRFVLASDVDNPLLGCRGAAAVYAPQKGASPEQVQSLEAGLQRWAELIDRRFADLPGAGAAGGVGFAALAVLGARRRPGAEAVLELVGFPEHLEGATLAVTGEGSLDRQTLSGKAPAGVAAAARAAGVPVVAVCGRCRLTARELLEAGFDEAYSLEQIAPSPSHSMRHAKKLLALVGRRIADERLV